MQNENNEDLEKEILILSSLQHPNIVRLIGLKKDKGELYMVMEFMNGGNLLQYIRKYEASLKENDLLDMTQQIALGMEYLEEKKIIHKFSFFLILFLNFVFFELTFIIY